MSELHSHGDQAAAHETIISLLWARAEQRPHEILYTFTPEGRRAAICQREVRAAFADRYTAGDVDRVMTQARCGLGVRPAP